MSRGSAALAPPLWRLLLVLFLPDQEKYVQISLLFIEENGNAAAIIRSGINFYFFNTVEYPLPYWTHRETRLKVAEEISDCCIT